MFSISRAYLEILLDYLFRIILFVLLLFYILIGGSLLYFLLLLSYPFLYKPLYKIFIRRHLILKPLPPRLYVYIFIIIFLLTLLLYYVNNIIKIRLIGQYIALFSGLYRISVLVGDYKTVLIIVSGFGIALIYKYNACKTYTRRVYLSLLNNTLTNDTLDNSYISSLNNIIILGILIYIKLGGKGKVLFGKRAIVYKGSINLEMIL
ncbi:hypothetical protein V2W45_1466420 [Cenococcum geophilum]